MLLLLIVILILSVLYFKRSVLITAATLLLMPQWTSGISGIKLSYAVVIFQCAFYFVWIRRNNDQISKASYPKWIVIPCVLASLGYILSNLFGDTNNVSISIVNIVTYFVYPYVIFKLIKSKKDLNFYIHAMFVFMLIVGIYALFEAVLKINIISNVAKEMGMIESVMGTEEVGERFGFARCSSILSYSSVLGMTSAVTYYILLYLKSKGFYIEKKTELTLLILLPICVLLSGTRSQMVVFFICVIPFFFYNEFRKTDTFKIFLILCVVLLLLGGSLLLTIVDSIIHSDKAELGSSSEMRLQQLEICLFYFYSSPLLGHGKNYMWEFVRPNNPALLGAESVWFQLIVDYGLLGCFTYFLIIAGLIVWLYKFEKILCFLPLSFLVGKTMSIVIGIELNYVIIISIILVKTNLFMKYDSKRISIVKLLWLLCMLGYMPQTYYFLREKYRRFFSTSTQE